jgi:hypothetical protein
MALLTSNVCVTLLGKGESGISSLGNLSQINISDSADWLLLLNDALWLLK